MKRSAIALLSGGLDSAVAALLVLPEAQIRLALTFDYGQRAAGQEAQTAGAFCQHYKIEHKVISLDWLASLSSSALIDRTKVLPRFSPNEIAEDKQKNSAAAVWVPNRNAVFISIAAAFAEARECDWIVAGFNAEEALTFPDNSTDFIEACNASLNYSTLSHPQIKSPTARLKKVEIIKEALRGQMPLQFFWSCYEGGASMCGTCESCVRTIRAFKEAKVWELVSNRFAGK